ncbi:hypothetical protein GX50_08817 [[Emmonsia] crescens]|uniref:Uncharacterized protein n=1 Tax=[Emmonsia] crescens TaxID=73230 RepID=A0A2B7YWJ3_9EURO|nr:hypothetical protein GX50_08817 [Emmonsia crescens]
MASHTQFGAKTTVTEAVKAFADQIKGLTGIYCPYIRRTCLRVPQMLMIPFVLVMGVNLKDLGDATVMAIAEQHPTRIIITGRSQEKLDEITKDKFSSFESVFSTLCPKCRRKDHQPRGQHNRHAGIIAPTEREVSGNGFEMHLATNHIGHFLLTNLLMDKIQLTATKHPGSVALLSYQFSPFHFQGYNFDGSSHRS